MDNYSQKVDVLNRLNSDVNTLYGNKLDGIKNPWFIIKLSAVKAAKG